MSQLVVLVRDREGHNPKLVGEGHVIEVFDDAMQWSGMVLTNPNMRIIRAPDLSMVEARTLESEQYANPQYYVPAARAFWLDPEKWPADVQAWYADDSRAQPWITLTREQVLAAKTVEPRYERADVLGGDPIIG